MYLKGLIEDLQLEEAWYHTEKTLKFKIDNLLYWTVGDLFFKFESINGVWGGVCCWLIVAEIVAVVMRAQSQDYHNLHWCYCCVLIIRWGFLVSVMNSLVPSRLLFNPVPMRSNIGCRLKLYLRVDFDYTFNNWHS